MVSVKKSGFDIIRAPRITEKAAVLGSLTNVVVFDVHPKANKADIRRAVERAFDVQVGKVRTANYQGKLKRVRANIGHQNAWKKAYVTLKEGSSLNLVEGL